MKEYINNIALLASAFIKSMKKEVEARQDTVIGSNLLEDMGTEEDMTDKQLQNGFLSTIEKEVDTTAEGAEEEEETDVNKMWRLVPVVLCTWRKTWVPHM